MSTQISTTITYYADGSGAASAVYFSSDGEKLSTSKRLVNDFYENNGECRGVCFLTCQQRSRL